MQHRRLDRAAGVALAATLILRAAFEWGAAPVAGHAASLSAVVALALLARGVDRTRQAFLLIGLVLVAAAFATLPDAGAAVTRAAGSAAFIVAFFTALSSLRGAAVTSAPIAECGRFLADQPPGRRYLALTLGGGLFGIILLYGAISLLGSLAVESARSEANAEIRGHRIRRMLVAIQRGFIATIPWSPLTFAIAISTTLVPGASWGGAVLPCLVSGLILAGTGWALDTIFKPRLTGPRPSYATPDGTWGAKMRPLLILLAVLAVSIAGLHLLTGIRVIGVVMVVVPVLSFLWIAEQDVLDHRPGVIRDVAGRAWRFASVEMPAMRSEIVLLAMAGFIGSLGASLAAPFVASAGIDASALPPALLLVGLFWVIPVTGQLGMNPILAASLLVPLLPAPAVMGIDPAAAIVAITSGWALSGATSPFTASVMLIGNFGGVRPTHAGLAWNGMYAACCGLLLTGWILVAASIL
ncbi:hypothetical protein [Palleronia pelagia]|uniref:H+/citrate symporter n=1 Tax=Palleronia pelagia TaxID=387096 RepID=A0A1H8M8A5_9RHOB|nr:hypothetical protein [Palleronia pelagia]SEO13632.1 hypothetical protein SAMN04488011_11414 [Palleronia pelagia]